MNTCICYGRLGADPDLRETTNSCVANFNLATRIPMGEEKTQWMRVVAFGRLAELCVEYLSKGSGCVVRGFIQTRSYEKDGATRYITELVADDVQFTDPAPRAQEAKPKTKAKASKAKASKAKAFKAKVSDDVDPF